MSKTIAEYLIENYGENAIELYWGKNNILSPYDYKTGSNKKVWFICQEKNYHKEYESSIYSFCSGCRCSYCGNNGRVHFLDSFGKWLEDNDYIKFWSLNNILSPYDIKPNSQKKILMVCDKKEYHGDYEISPAKFISGRRCGYCKKDKKLHSLDSFAQYHIDNTDDKFLEKYWDYEKNIINPFEISPNSVKLKIFIKCQNIIYHSYNITPNAFTQGNRCNLCHGEIKHEKDSLGNYLINKFGEEGLDNYWSIKNKLDPYKLSIRSGKKIWWKCPCGKHEDYEREVNNAFVYEYNCPRCKEEKEESSYQEKTRIYLEFLGYKINHEHKCSIIPLNPKTKRGMPFDNEVEELKLIIEVHGQTHYKETGFNVTSSKKNNSTPKKELDKCKLHDRYKSYIAFKNGYSYLELPYWSFNKNEDYKKLIDEKIIGIGDTSGC